MKQYETLTLATKVHKRVSPRNAPIWDVITEQGELVVANSKSPVRGASTILLLDWGWPQEKLVTFKHQSSEHESFVPRSLILFAESGLKNELKRLKALRDASQSPARRTRSGFKGFAYPALPEKLDEAVCTPCELLRRIQGMRESVQ